jgi:hypothetical protein
MEGVENSASQVCGWTNIEAPFVSDDTSLKCEVLMAILVYSQLLQEFAASIIAYV